MRGAVPEDDRVSLHLLGDHDDAVGRVAVLVIDFAQSLPFMVAASSLGGRIPADGATLGRIGGDGSHDA